MNIRTNHAHTIRACYIGYITQAIVNNLSPLLFLTFAASYGLSLDKITLITTLNFLIQLVVDLLSAKFIDRIGYRRSVMSAHICAALGLVLLAVLPGLLSDPYPGILTAVFFYAIGGGVIEVIISPIVEACPTAHKERAMSLLHSFYCWGHLGVVLLSTLFFHFAGTGRWQLLAVLWAIIPAANVFYFALVPIWPIVDEKTERLSVRGLIKDRRFQLFVLMMVCAGASEQGMSQWASAFAESALGVSKTVGDLLGPSAFALCMGTSRAIYGKFGDRIPLSGFMMWSAVLCIFCYLAAAFAGLPPVSFIGCAFCGFSVGIFWTGTFSVAARALPGGGTAMYALLALAGDLGCSSGPTFVGLIANAADGGLRTGLAAAVIFPVLMLVCVLMSGRRSERRADA